MGEDLGAFGQTMARRTSPSSETIVR